MSEAERMIRDLNNYLKTQNVLYEILDESKVDVYYLKGLYDAMKTGATTRVADRIQRANQLKNYLNALVLDLDDKYESKTQTFSGLAEVMNENRIGIAAALRRPMTKLFGLSPAGFSNGDSDLDTYYQLVESEERTQLKPVIRKVIDLVCQHLFGFIPSYKLSFPPLKQLSEKDQEEIKNHRLTRILQMKEAQMITAAEAVEMAKKENILDIKTATELSITPVEEPETMYRVERVNSINLLNDAEFESKHKRNPDGTFGSGGGESKKSSQKLDGTNIGEIIITEHNSIEIKNRLHKKFEEMAVPFETIDFSRENYDKLFPENKVTTPNGEVKIGAGQLDKLQERDRKKLLLPMYKTLSDPIAIIHENIDGKEADLYIKTFRTSKIKAVQSVVVGKDGIKVSISTHERGINNLLNKIKPSNKLIFEKMKTNSLATARPTREASLGNSTETSDLTLFLVYHFLE